jgi:hypothetical protein
MITHIKSLATDKQLVLNEFRKIIPFHPVGSNETGTNVMCKSLLLLVRKLLVNLLDSSTIHMQQ